MSGEGNALTGLWFDGQKHYADILCDNRQEFLIPVFKDTIHWLDLYFNGADPGFTPALKPAGSSFRRQVWDILLQIPFAHTMTYGQIAARIAKEQGLTQMSAQAVGGAVAHNPISLIIPCHRVVGTHGSLTGYAGGLERKARLLQLEGALSPSRP